LAYLVNNYTRFWGFAKGSSGYKFAEVDRVNIVDNKGDELAKNIQEVDGSWFHVGTIGYNKNPWQRLVRPYQKQGNVVLLQGVQPEERDACVPCREEGCDRHRKSNSICLQYLSASTVVRAVDEWLL